ncbi:fused DSP-PTPase phosphatase/NAD kinase-like protein [Yoonia sediminilitoris]|uniref:Tyrosine phosphatase family protein n=1 Tax=Yoonia sediminilitoris TaxID=1286148 RepID=A0A2T6KJZ1_9RHOB|nr:tyrosine-protein phosphatase [Yoonia sediminilitoris]PUB16274.1 tyrosine phosphatase family protein [Yoonia sediminilitoris]RCW96623.1 tyrosine phosphatase family protein [Yoonia sediminilitoris]
MIRKLSKYLEQKEYDFRKSFGHDITDPVERKRSVQHVRWLDHGILRVFWHNVAEFAPGAYRSNHPDHKRLSGFHKQGIKTVLNLRGEQLQPHYLFEEESCKQLGLTLVNVKMAARKAPSVDALVRLMDAFDTIEHPFVVHCKSGADRTGLAATLYLMLQEGQPIEVARKQLSFRFLHIRRTETGILDHFLDVYAARNATSPIPVDQWIKEEYDRAALIKSFRHKQENLRFWQGWR